MQCTSSSSLQTIPDAQSVSEEADKPFVLASCIRYEHDDTERRHHSKHHRCVSDDPHAAAATATPRRTSIVAVEQIKEAAAHSHKTRWVVLFVYCLLSASNGFQWINYAPIVDEVKEFFEMSSLQVNFLATIYAIVYPALIIVGCVVFQSVGWQGGMVIGSLLNAIGAIMKVVGALWVPHFGFLAVSQCINAFSEVFFLSLPPLIASVWFSSRQRTLATAIGVMSNSLGTAFGFIVPPLLVTKADHGTSAFVQLFGYQAGVAVLILVASALLPSRPSHMPSLTSAKDTSLRDLIPSLRYLITHVPFVVLAFASGLNNDSLGVFASFLAQLLQPFGISELEAGWIGFAMTISGSIASTVVGVYIDRNRQYKATLMTFSLGAVSSSAAVALILLYGDRGTTASLFGWVFVFVSLLGGFLSAQIPLQLEYAVELTYPKPEGVTTAFLLCLSGILTPLLTLGGTEMVGDNPGKADVVRFMMGCLGLSTMSAMMQLFIRDHRHRVDIEAIVPIQRHSSWVEEHEGRH